MAIIQPQRKTHNCLFSINVRNCRCAKFSHQQHHLSDATCSSNISTFTSRKVCNTWQILGILIPVSLPPVKKPSTSLFHISTRVQLQTLMSNSPETFNYLQLRTQTTCTQRLAATSTQPQLLSCLNVETLYNTISVVQNEPAATTKASGRPVTPARTHQIRGRF